MMLGFIITNTMVSTQRKKGFVTANAASHWPLAEWLPTLPGQHVVAIQEHHVTMDKPADYEQKLLYVGWKGLWSPASATTKGDSSGGAAVAAPSSFHLSAHH